MEYYIVLLLKFQLKRVWCWRCCLWKPSWWERMKRAKLGRSRGEVRGEPVCGVFFVLCDRWRHSEVKTERCSRFQSYVPSFRPSTSYVWRTACNYCRSLNSLSQYDHEFLEYWHTGHYVCIEKSPHSDGKHFRVRTRKKKTGLYPVQGTYCTY